MNNDDRIDEVVNEMASDYNAPPAVQRDLMWERIQAARKVTPLPVRRGVPTWATWGVGLAAMLAIGIGIGRMKRETTTSPVATTMTAPTDSAATRVAIPNAEVPDSQTASQTVAPRAKTPGPARSDRDDQVAVAEGTKTPSVETSVTAARSGWRGNRPANSDAAALPYRLAALQHMTRVEALLTSYEAEAKAGRQDDQMQAWSKDLLSTTRLLMDSPAGRDPKLRPLLEDLELVLAQIQQATSSHGRTSDREMVVDGMEKRGVLPRLRTAIPAGPSAGI